MTLDDAGQQEQEREHNPKSLVLGNFYSQWRTIRHYDGAHYGTWPFQDADDDAAESATPSMGRLFRCRATGTEW